MDQNWSYTNLQPFVDAINNLADAIREHASLQAATRRTFMQDVTSNYIEETLTNAKKNRRQS